jgi:N-acetylglutamate synthase-like GNAT family acetyltransferase
MNSSDYRVRRATLDDMGALKTLWQTMRFPEGDLEKRLTEFQVVEGPNHQLVGALGFQMIERQGCIHSETFADFAVAEAMRPLLWGRIQSLATNHGLVRIWTRETAPFWTHNGFQPVGEKLLPKLPPPWQESGSHWLALQLKDEEAIASLEKEFAMFVEAEKSRSEQALGQARALKSAVTILSLLIAAAILIAAIYVFVRNRGGGLPAP